MHAKVEYYVRFPIYHIKYGWSRHVDYDDGAKGRVAIGEKKN